MTLLYAVLYHVVVAIIDCYFKGRIKRKHNWDWNAVPSFWKSKNKGVLSWELMLFSISWIISLLLLSGVYGFSYLLLEYSFLVFLLGISGVESVLYWWIGSLTGWERAWWRKKYRAGKAYMFRDGQVMNPDFDTLRPFEYPPVANWLKKFPMIYWFKYNEYWNTGRTYMTHPYNWYKAKYFIEPTRDKVLMCSALSFLLCVVMEVIIGIL